MIRILVFSDTHGDINNCIKLIDNCRPDMVIHAGDYVSDVEDLIAIYPDLPIHYVKGNNDFFSKAPDEKVVEVEGNRIFITHGHKFRVKSTEELILKKAKEYDLTIFGHTHMPFQNYSPDVINPGSIKYLKNYAVIEIEDCKMKYAILKV